MGKKEQKRLLGGGQLWMNWISQPKITIVLPTETPPPRILCITERREKLMPIAPLSVFPVPTSPYLYISIIDPQIQPISIGISNENSFLKNHIFPCPTCTSSSFDCLNLWISFVSIWAPGIWIFDSGFHCFFTFLGVFFSWREC